LLFLEAGKPVDYVHSQDPQRLRSFDVKQGNTDRSVPVEVVKTDRFENSTLFEARDAFAA
jgi:hypothetical protein